MPCLKYFDERAREKGREGGERELLINDWELEVPSFFAGQRVADVPVCWKTRECVQKMYPFFDCVVCMH